MDSVFGVLSRARWSQGSAAIHYRLAIGIAGIAALLVGLPFVEVDRPAVLTLLIGLAVLADIFLTVPLQEQRLLSFGSTFTFAILLEFGAVPAGLAHAASLTALALTARRNDNRPPRLLLFTIFNVGQLAISAIAAGSVLRLVYGSGLVSAPSGGGGALLLFALLFLIGNVALTTGAIWLSRGWDHVVNVLWPTTSLWTAISFLFSVPLALSIVSISATLPIPVSAILVFIALAILSRIIRLDRMLTARNLDLARANLELQTLNEAGQSLATQEDMDSLFTTLYQQVSRLVRADGFLLATTTEQSPGYEVQWIVEHGAPRVAAVDERCRIVEHVLATKQPLLIENRADLQALGLEPCGTGALAPAAVIAVPLSVSGRVAGVLLVMSSSDGVYRPRHVTLLETVGNHAAAAFENVRLVEQLRQALRDREEYLSVVSHELRNPISAIRAYAQLAARRVEADDDPKLSQSLQRIDEQTARLSRLVEDLLELSRVDSGRFALETADTDLLSLVGDRVESARTTFTGHRIMFSAPASEIRVVIDPPRIQQVVDNLITNAVKYSEPGTEVRVTLVEEDDEVQISVTDQGIGIPAEDQQRIFERFFRVDSSDGSQTAGLGIGLNVVREIVRAHGGSIDLVSTVGVGSTFTVHLPKAARVVEHAISQPH